MRSAAILPASLVSTNQLNVSESGSHVIIADHTGHAIACDFFGEDGKEGVDAFLGKRAPQWKHRP
jgi:1,4-dihydroxy-2-naphthoyl-CoA synthase